MDQAVFNIFEAFGAIGALSTGITALFGIKKYLANIKIKNELLYGKEADERLAHTKEHFKEGSYTVLPTFPYGGGEIRVPRLLIEKLSPNSETIEKAWSGKIALIKYYRKATEQELETYKAESRDMETPIPTISIDRWLL